MSPETLSTTLMQPYEVLLALLREDIAPALREHLEAELKSRDRALHNQYLALTQNPFK